MEIKNALSYSKLLVDFDNDAAFERIVNVPTRGIGAKTLDSVREHARAKNISLWKAAESISKDNLKKSSRALSHFIETVSQLKTDTENKGLGEIFDEIINTTGLKDFHAKEPGEKGRSRKENLEELVSAASGFNPIGEDADDDRNELEIFLDQAWSRNISNSFLSSSASSPMGLKPDAAETSSSKFSFLDLPFSPGSFA